MDTLSEFVSDYPDFPKEGILFKDIMPILASPKMFSEVVENMASSEIVKKAEAIIAIESRGFIFGSAIAIKAAKPLITARKPGKLPGDLVKKNYTLEYGESSLEIQRSALKSFSDFVIVDDLLATGGTAECVIKLLNKCKKRAIGISIVIELSALKARKRINIPIDSQVAY